MTYSGLDISQIKIGSKCFYGKMINNYSYDELHRITQMDNIFYSPTPFPEAFNTSYTYDDAGNILTLKRKGFVGYDNNTPQFELIDDLEYGYGNNGPSSILSQILDHVEDDDHRAFGLSTPTLTDPLFYGFDGNGNMVGGGQNAFSYNILNLPETIVGPSGMAEQEYVSSGMKYKKEDDNETRLYIGGVEWVDDAPESFFFGDGRIVWEETEDETIELWPQYRLTDHLGNTVVFFEDKDEDGIIKTELVTNDPEVLEVKQRLWYYPFGMQMDGIVDEDTDPNHAYRYNGKELDEVSKTYDYGARYYDPTIARWGQVDPLADHPNQVDKSVYAYAWNNPILFIDPDGKCPRCYQFIWLKDKISSAWSDYRATANGLKNAYSSLTGKETTFMQNVGFEITAATSHFGSFTSQNDASVLMTGENMDGTRASFGEKVLAGVFVALPISGSVVKEGTEGAVTSIYRAISNGELDDIAASGLIRPGKNSLETKLFTDNLEDAIKQGDARGGGYSIIKVDIPNSTLEQLEIMQVDLHMTTGNTIAVHPDKLELFNNTKQSVSVYKNE